MLETDFDTIIVGGGSAGCVLAGRLSARSANRVLLIEAGRDLPPGLEPDDVLDNDPLRAYANPNYQWPDLRVRWKTERRNAPRRRPAPSAMSRRRLLGGGSSINGQIATRGAPVDYDAWQDMGAEGWGWDGVLPYFRKLERDMDFTGPSHGDVGPASHRPALPRALDRASSRRSPRPPVRPATRTGLTATTASPRAISPSQ